MVDLSSATLLPRAFRNFQQLTACSAHFDALDEVDMIVAVRYLMIGWRWQNCPVALAIRRLCPFAFDMK